MDGNRHLEACVQIECIHFHNCVVLLFFRMLINIQWQSINNRSLLQASLGNMSSSDTIKK